VGRYKRVSHAGGADESLFGSQPAAGSRKVEQMLRQPPAQGDKVEFDSVVITTSDLQRLRMAASAEGPGAADRRALAAEQAMKADGQARAKARKEKMLAMEATRKANLAKSDLELEDEQTMSILQEGAQRAKDEDLDPVKGMNRMMQYAKCVTIRDAQLIEKQMIIKAQQHEEAEFFQRMEDERIKTIKLMEEREEMKKEERMRGAQIIRRQIEEREQEKIREADRLDQERQAMLKKAEEIKELELAREEERRLAGQRMLQEAAQTNAASIQRKVQLKQEAEDENLRIAAYIAERDRKEQERQDELEAEARRKAEDVARLRAMQEKQADRAAEMDAVRAKRSAEDYERAWRAKERAEAEKKAAQLADILQSREQMAVQKQRVLSQAAQMEKEQFQRILQVQRDADGVQVAKERARHEQNMAHNVDLRNQISDNTEKRERNRQEFLDEGAKQRFAVEKERRRIEAIKNGKMDELRRAGVPGKYLAELEGSKASF